MELEKAEELIRDARAALEAKVMEIDPDGYSRCCADRNCFSQLDHEMQELVTKIIEYDGMWRRRSDENMGNVAAALHQKFRKMLREFRVRKLAALLPKRRRKRAKNAVDQLPENIPEVSGEETRRLAAKEAGFGNETTYRQAKTVVDSGIPELVKKMDTGEVSISAAALIARQNADKQPLSGRFAPSKAAHAKYSRRRFSEFFGARKRQSCIDLSSIS